MTKKQISIIVSLLLSLTGAPDCRAKSIKFNLDKHPNKYSSGTGSGTSITDASCEIQHFFIYKEEQNQRQSIATIKMTKAAFFQNLEKGMVIPIKYTEEAVDCYNSDQYFYLTDLQYMKFSNKIKNNKIVQKQLIVSTQPNGSSDSISFEAYEPGYAVIKSVGDYEYQSIEAELLIKFPRSNSYMYLTKCKKNSSGQCSFESNTTQYYTVYKSQLGISIKGHVKFSNYLDSEENNEG